MASISKHKPYSKKSMCVDDESVKATVLDAVRLSEKRGVPRFVGFLDEHQKQYVQALLSHVDSDRYLFYGGYSDAERQYLGIFPDESVPRETLFPICRLTFQYRKGIELKHRDFLGTMLSCGIKREKIGDILCSDGLTVAFVETEIARFLIDQITKVGGEGVQLIPDYLGDIPTAHTFAQITNTIASPRIDAVVRTAAGISREEAGRRIESGQVSVNHQLCTKADKNIEEADIVSIRGAGRFVIEKIGPITRKGRMFISIKKYL